MSKPFIFLVQDNRNIESVLSLIDLNSPVTFRRLPFNYSRFSPLSYIYLTFLINYLQPDLFFSAYAWLPFFKVSSRIKAIFVCHDLFAPLDSRFFLDSTGFLKRFYLYLLLRLSLINCTTVVTPSYHIKLQLANKFGLKKSRITSIPNLLPRISSFHQFLFKSFKFNIINLLYVGNTRFYKGVKYLLEACLTWWLII